jgi:bifunctional ADP-heptose synthase (sugar kinase/adenylyltransferase)
MIDTALIEHILTTIPNRTVGVLGDLFLDRYLDIDAVRNEPSVETGLTAYQVVKVRAYPGAAGTVINNLAALGVGRIYPIAYLGDDGEGYELRQALRALPAVEHGGLTTAPGRRTPTYTKPMLGKDELNRLDIKNRAPTPGAVEEMIIDLLDEAWPQLDALIVLDQVSEADCGVVTKRVRERLAELGELYPEKFVLADSREQIELFRNVCVKPNTAEIGHAFLRNSERGGEETFPTAPAIFQTSGVDGIWLHRLLAPAPRLIPAYPVSGPIDIVGAGDSCSAGITAAMVSGATPEQAAAFGNLVASITIQQIGVTGTASPEQVRRRWKEVGGTRV